ncbi:MAG: tetratricopeptide repeat protein [Planctomycetota bacterium]|jgi:tetratricopeptide (TPR) repeat protein
MKVQIIALFLILAMCPGLAFPLDPRQVETEEDLEFLEEALRAGYGGQYRQAVRDLEEYLADFPESIRAWAGLAEIERIRGRYEAAQTAGEESLRLDPSSTSAHLALAGILYKQGEHGPAGELLRKAFTLDEKSLEVRAALARFLFETGRREEARTLAEESIRQLEQSPGDGEGLCALSELYLLLGELEQAARAAVYGDERFNGRKGKNYRYARYEALLILGDLYRRTRLGMGGMDKGSGNRALDCYNDALQINPNLPETLLGMAATRFYALRFNEAGSSLDKALSINPVHGGALALKAHLLTLTRQYERAIVLVERGLEANPRDKRLWAQKAALHLFHGETARHDEALAKAIEIDPSFGEAYYVLAELLIYHYRFPEAEAAVRKCLELDPDFHEAYVLLGRTLANLGRENEAQEALKTSTRKDPFNYPWRNNMLRVLAELDAYLKLESDRFNLALDVDEAEVMRRYLLRLSADSVDYFQDKFDYELENPLLMEMFPDHRDFAVRTVGFTGLGALGACFGEVVTLLSPRAEPLRGTFSWASTLHHELCHVFTMQMSRYRIPRWFTEGISVNEEENRKKSWRRNMDMVLFNNYHNNRLFRLESFDQDFLGPRVLFAYYQAGLVVKYIEEQYGIDKLSRMIRAYGEDLDTRQVVERVFDQELGALEEAFKNWLWSTRLAGIECLPFYSEEKRQDFVYRAKKDSGNLDALLKAAWACQRNDKHIDALYYLNKALEIAPDHPRIQLLQGEMAFSKGNKEKARKLYEQAVDGGQRDMAAFRNLGILALEEGDIDEAIRYLEEAKACFPTFIDPGSPRQLLMTLYVQEEMQDEAIAEMTGMVEEGLQDIAVLLHLAAYHEDRGEWEQAGAYYQDAVYFDPFQREVHVKLARSLREGGEYARALDELDMAEAVPVELEPKQSMGALTILPTRDENASLAGIHAEKAEVHIALGDLEKAALEVEKALSLKADHPRALELKKKLEI